MRRTRASETRRAARRSVAVSATRSVETHPDYRLRCPVKRTRAPEQPLRIFEPCKIRQGAKQPISAHSGASAQPSPVTGLIAAVECGAKAFDPNGNPAYNQPRFRSPMTPIRRFFVADLNAKGELRAEAEYR